MLLAGPNTQQNNHYGQLTVGTMANAQILTVAGTSGMLAVSNTTASIPVILEYA